MISKKTSFGEYKKSLLNGNFINLRDELIEEIGFHGFLQGCDSPLAHLLAKTVFYVGESASSSLLTHAFPENVDMEALSTIKDHKGRNMWHIAAKAHNFTLLSQTRDALDVLDDDGNSICHFVATGSSDISFIGKCETAVLEELMLSFCVATEHNINIEAERLMNMGVFRQTKNRHGETPIDLAIKTGRLHYVFSIPQRIDLTGCLSPSSVETLAKHLTKWARGERQRITHIPGNLFQALLAAMPAKNVHAIMTMIFLKHNPEFSGAEIAELCKTLKISKNVFMETANSLMEVREGAFHDAVKEMISRNGTIFCNDELNKFMKYPSFLSWHQSKTLSDSYGEDGGSRQRGGL